MKWVTDQQSLLKRMMEASSINKVMTQGMKLPTKIPLTFKEKKPGSSTLRASDRDIDKSYEIYKSPEARDKAIKRKFHLWVQYPNPGYSRNLQRQYEIFCGGYLQFYESVLSNEGRQRLVYLLWTKQVVQIYLSNPPKGKGYKDSVNKFKKTKYVYVDYDIQPTSDSDVDPPPLPNPPPPPDA